MDRVRCVGLAAVAVVARAAVAAVAVVAAADVAAVVGAADIAAAAADEAGDRPYRSPTPSTLG
jgi:hypothetical protein